MPASQAGRRRFDPGRPLHSFSQQSQLLVKMSGLRRYGVGGLSAINGIAGASAWGATAAALDQICALPPSTKSSIPVTKLESSDARKRAALAISSDSPMRPIGMVDAIHAIASAGSPSITGVSVGPGLTTFERM